MDSSRPTPASRRPPRPHARQPRRSTGADQAASEARALAWHLLERVEAGAFADALLGTRLSASGVPERDHPLVTRLVYGTLAWQGYLDHILGAFSRRPPEQLDVPIRTLLRLALFQMCVLTRIPDFAAVNTAVDLAKRFRGGSAVSFVNAVLRRAAAGWQGVALPPRDTDPATHLAVRLSHPRWLVAQWLAQYGFEATEALLRANNEPAPTVLRANRRCIAPLELVAQLRAAGVTAEPVAYAPAGIRVEHAGPPERLPGYTDGLFCLQGEASQLVGLLLDPQPGERILDACAAPGGKATHFAELMDDRGTVVALDANARGVDRIRRTAARLGLTIVKAEVADAMRWPVAQGPFDRVLVDAPCSGLGTLRQHPEVKWRRTPDDVAALAELQQSLLRAAAAHVRPGGILVYATCTLSAAENEHVVAAFLREQSLFAIEDPTPALPAAAQPLIGSEGALRTFPHQHGLDGFFAVRLKRRAENGIVPT